MRDKERVCVWIFPVVKGQKLVPGLAVGNPPPEEYRSESGFIYLFLLCLTQNYLKCVTTDIQQW